MQEGREFISDYEDNKEEIERWFSIKCEQKYRQFAKLLESRGEETTWINVRDLYRYDKRLIFNCFKYISFLEEYLRASIVRNSEDKEGKYAELQEAYLSDLIGPIIELYEKGKFRFDGGNLKKTLKKVKDLRNCISHNKIVLEKGDYASELEALRDLLPPEHSDSFVKTIKESRKNLVVSQKWTVTFIDP